MWKMLAILILVLTTSTVTAATIINPVSATSSSCYDLSASRAPNVIDSTDLSSSNLHVSIPWTKGPCWLSDNVGDASDEWIYFDLGSVYDLEDICIWNYHENSGGKADVSGRSIKEFSLWVAGPGAKFPSGPTAAAFHGLGWIRVDVGATTLAKAPPTDPDPGNIGPTDLFSLGSQKGIQYIGIDVGSNYGGQPFLPNSVGMAQIQITGLSRLPNHPVPWDGQGLFDLNRVLSWDAPASYGSCSYRIYLDSDKGKVASGDGSVLVGTLSGKDGHISFDPDTYLTFETTYFWRVDTIESEEGRNELIHKGSVWSFSTAQEDLDFDEIIFVKRKPYSSDHYYTDIDNGTSEDRFLPDNGIYIYDVRTGQERPVVSAVRMPGGKGFIGKISLSFDAKKVVFDFRENPGSGFRIWEVNIDGTGLRQITSAPADEAKKVARWGKPFHTDDIHPCYLPDGKIIFSSTRCEHTILCGDSAHLVTAVLHRMDSDGGNIEQLSQSPVSEFCPVVLDDGRVMYHRWEYVDKGSRVCKTIWSMNPDGSMPQELYGVSDDSTTVYMYPQAIPGSGGERLVSVGTCHYPQGGCLGAIMLLDLQRDIRKRGPDPDEAGYVKWDDRYVVTNITPHVFLERRTGDGWHFLGKDGKYVHDGNGTSGHLYTHPYPISEDTFLVSYKVDPSDHYQNVANAYVLCLIDTEGNHRLVHKDDHLSCWHPTPLKSRKVPPEIHNFRNEEYMASNEALCIVKNVYEGMEGVGQGEVRWLRINEVIPRYWDTGRRWGSATNSGSWKAALWPRVQWGVVPVEKDGSAFFKVPANRNIFFQALDENFRELQRERTYVNYKPGETRSCLGCHGRNNHTTRSAGTEMPIALGRGPSTPQPQPCDLVENGGDGLAQQVIHYPMDIQPIFDTKCVSCHGKEKPAGSLKLTGDLTAYYNISYEELCKKQLAGPIVSEFTTFQRGDQGNYNGATLPPRSMGSYNSIIIDMLTDSRHAGNAKDDHSKMLNENELMILSRWVDSNYQFYGTYYGRHHWHWVTTDPGNESYKPENFRRKPKFEEAISMYAPKWHR